MMRFSQVTVALFLCLLLGLSTSVSVVHNYSYHDNHLAHDEHDEHDESNCAYTVVQHSESSLTQEIPDIVLPSYSTPKTTVFVDLKIPQKHYNFLVRAPPTSV